MRKKRLADWLEKISAAFIVASLIAEKGFIIPASLGIICFCVSMFLTDKEAR